MKILGFGKEQLMWIGLRLVLGWTIFWAFLDKLFGLYPTSTSAAWINGGSPTAGYLAYGTSGPLEGFYSGLAENVIVDSLFMLALLAIGLALLLGIGMRIAGYAGAIFMIILWSTHLPPAYNPIVDEHIFYAIALLGMAHVRAGQWFGLGEWWANQSIVKRYPILE